MPSDAAPKEGLRWRPGQLASNGAVLLGWMVLRAAAQVALVVLLARMLGAQPYGPVVAVVATASFLVPFAGLGLSNMLLRNAARDPVHKGTYFAIALRWWRRTLLPCAALAVAFALMLLPAGLPLAAVCAATVVEVAAASATELWARYRQAEQRTHVYGAINAGLPLVRVLALGLLFWFVADADAAAVLWGYAASGVAYVLLLIGVRPRTTTETAAAKEPMAATSGLPFSVSALATRLQGEFNKPILAQVGFGLAGSFNVAQRAVDMACLPLLAMLEALWPRLYAQSNPIPQLWRTGLALIIIALGFGVAMWFAAPWLILVIGSDFHDAIDTMKWLALLPTLQIGRNLITFHSIHRGWMRDISNASISGGLTSVVAVSILIPSLGATGAVLGCYITEAVMSATLLTLAFRNNQRKHS